MPVLATPDKSFMPQTTGDSWPPIQLMASKIPVKHDTDIDSFSSSNGPNVKVIARFRPLDKAESSFRGRPASIQFLPDNSTLFFSSTELKPDVASLSKLRTYPPTSSAPGKTKAIFTFDRVFTPESTQQELFDYALKDTVDDLFNGYNGCVLAYGQTGSGKTYTMMGPASPEISHATNSNVESSHEPSNDLKPTVIPKNQLLAEPSKSTQNNSNKYATEKNLSPLSFPPLSPSCLHSSRGAIPRIIEAIFKIIDNSPKDIQYKVQISYMEIYQEKVRDLLASINPKYTDTQNDSTDMNLIKDKSKIPTSVSPPASTYNLPIHESSTKGVYVKDLTEMEASSLEDVLSIMETGARLRSTGSTLMNLQSSRSHAIFSLKLSQRSLITQAQKAGQLFLVDLAGSENIKKTGASGQALQESKLINKSLSALGNIINSLTDPNSSHVPYRDSKLTRVLQEAIGGNSRTSLIITCSPSSLDEVETLTTLRFGSRAKKIRNKAIINSIESPQEELRTAMKELSEKYEKEKTYSARLEDELSQWRRGNRPIKDSWVSFTSSLDSNRQPNGDSGYASKSLPHRRSVSILERQNITRNSNSTSHLKQNKNEKSLEDAGAYTKEDMFLKQIQRREDTLTRLQNNIHNLLSNSRNTELQNGVSNSADIGVAISTDGEITESLDNPSSANNFNFKQEKSLYTVKELKSNIEEVIKENNALKQTLEANPIKHPQPKNGNHFEVDFLKGQLSELLLENTELKYKQPKTIITDARQDSQDDSPVSEALRKHIMDLELTKKSLMHDLQSRCERIVELESKVKSVYDERMEKMKEHVLRTKFKKMALLEHNLAQLLEVQKQIIEQNNVLKRDIETTQNILEIRNQRIQAFESLLVENPARFKS